MSIKEIRNLGKSGKSTGNQERELLHLLREMEATRLTLTDSELKMIARAVAPLIGGMGKLQLEQLPAFLNPSKPVFGQVLQRLLDVAPEVEVFSDICQALENDGDIDAQRIKAVKKFFVDKTGVRLEFAELDDD